MRNYVEEDIETTTPKQKRVGDYVEKDIKITISQKKIRI